MMLLTRPGTKAFPWGRVLQRVAVGAVLLLLISSAFLHHDKVFRALSEGVGATTSSDTPSLQEHHPYSHFRQFPLAIPEGEAQPLPSVRVEAQEEEVARGIYGGKGDKKHLGGFTTYDGDGVSPAVWKHMIKDYGIKSIMDVGCGKGVSTLWFLLHGADVLCVEGSHDAVVQTLLPSSQVVEHDFSRGAYWPAKTYDAVWSVEFLEHVGRNYQYNYIQAFRKAALIFVSHSVWGGWHHVEVHKGDWWINKLESFGFRYSESMTKTVKALASTESRNATARGPNGKPYRAQHLFMNMQVFINPVVASLPEHSHLFSEHGCYKERGPKGEIIHKECGTLRGGHTESKLPESYYPLPITPDQDEVWLKRVKATIVDPEHQSTQ